MRSSTPASAGHGPLAVGCAASGPPRPTVDTLFELPETDHRYEVLDGKLVMSPAPTPAHSAALAGLTRLFSTQLPSQLWLLQGAAVRLPNGDGPIPNLLITSALD